jgi:hypothetical protein
VERGEPLVVRISGLVGSPVHAGAIRSVTAENVYATAGPLTRIISARRETILMEYPFPGIGVVFNIQGLGGGGYGFEAWRIFVRTVDPQRLAPCILVHGDTAATLNGGANEYCIGVYGAMLNVEYIREQFEAATDAGLAPFHRRFIEKIALDGQPLPIYGHVDALGRLVTDRWSSFDQKLCRTNTWGYAPRSVPDGLSPERLAELDELRKRWS